MKNLILSFFCCLITLSVMAQERYLEEVFEDFTKQEDIVYGNNYSYLQYLVFGNTVNQDLEMDIYAPAGDDLTERPVIITVHTGNFLPVFLNGSTTGERNDSAMVEMCQQLARRGFVVANISYRLGWNPISANLDIRRSTYINALYRGVQDIRTCARYLRKTVAEDGNPYGIDPSSIAMMGQGTGGHLVYAAATLNDIEETQIDDLLFVNEDGVLEPYINQEVLGTIDGFGFPDPTQQNGFIETDEASVFYDELILVNNPNHIGYSSTIDFGFAYGGGLVNTEWIDESSIPFAAAQVVTDPNTPFFTDLLIVSTTGEAVLEVNGAGTSMPIFNASPSNTPLLQDQLQDIYSVIIREQTTMVSGLGEQENIWAITSQDEVSEPWEWWDPNNPDYDFQNASGQFDENGFELTHHEANLLGNPDMSKEKALAYIDTLINFFAPRAILAMAVSSSENFSSPEIIKIQPFFDENDNAVLDNDEQSLYANLSFMLTPDAEATIYDSNGNATFYVEPAITYTVQYDSTSNPLWQITNAPTSYTLTTDEETDTTFYFSMRPVTDFILQNVDISSSITRCNQESNVWLTYTNNSSNTNSGYVNLVVDELVSFVSATPPVDSIAGDILYWFYEDLYPTHSEQIHAIFAMPEAGVDGANIGENLVFEAEMQTWDGEGEAKFYYSSELICAYDPNDKLVTPDGIGEEKYTLFVDSLLNYTIRFQNTGNDTAFNIIVRDTISEHLDFPTYNFVASSHDVKTQINEEERLIEFIFDDIYLPDSNVNEPGSHGFVKFTMEINNNLAEETPIENKAGIFFDFNPAIITNTTQNLMVSTIPTNLDVITTQNHIQIYPNPNTGTFVIEAKNKYIKSFTLYNSVGQLVNKQAVNSLQTMVNMPLDAGIYFLSIQTEQGVVVEKVMVQ